MKRNILFLLLAGCMLMFTSCLKSGLDEIENSSLCAVSSVTMEYRWITQNANGYDQMSRQQLTLSNNAPDENNEIHFVVEVPAASATFPEDIRNVVELDGLYMIMVISPAAKVVPLEDAPVLGVPGNYEIGKSYKYQVTAANGDTAIYTVVIEDFVK